VIGPASSWALGLGDITLQSSLGQPFKASVELFTSPGDKYDEDCFETRPENDAGVPNVEGIKIAVQSRSDGARLLLSSRHPVNEPAVSITLSTDCPQRLSRKYVVLLDPPLIVDTPVVPAATASSSGHATAESVSPIALETTHGQRSRFRDATRPRVSSAQRHRRARRPKLGPRLILSGRPRALASPTALALHVDRSFSEPGNYQPAPPNPIDVSDENAALKHKIAYLEQQLHALQLRNAALDQTALNYHAVKPEIKPTLAYPHSWQTWLLAPTLPVAVGALLAWGWRRNRRSPRAVAEVGHPPEPIDGNEPVSGWQSDLNPIQLEAPAMPVFAAPGETVEVHTQHVPASPPQLLKRVQDDGVELDDSVMDEAEVFMAHGHAELAINLLQEHVREAPDESPIPWMLLLDLLRRSRQARDYAETGQVCKQYFNIRIPDMNEDDPGPDAAGLEAYPHVLAELARLWNTPECETYLDDLIFDRRGGTRNGFDPPTFREIMLLRTIQVSESPRLAA
jgi:hypothetical protein